MFWLANYGGASGKFEPVLSLNSSDDSAVLARGAQHLHRGLYRDALPRRSRADDVS